MGMEIIRLGETGSQAITREVKDTAKLNFSTHHVPDPKLSIWLMNAEIGKPILPWWNYSAVMDEEIQRLNTLWSVTSAQTFFDCMYLSQFKKMAGSNLFAIVPGYLRTDGWDKLPESSRVAYLRGQGCVYRLEGSFDSKLSINWVPFAQPQSLLKDASFEALWPMFVAARNDDVANSIGFFSLTDLKKLPQVVSLLIQTNENRSLELADVVDWFSLYSSPLTPDHSACSVVYTKEQRVLQRLAEFEMKFQTTVNEVRDALAQSPNPHTVFRILSRFVAI